MPDSQKNCLFCEIIQGTIPSDCVYQDALCFAFKDISPQAPHHILIIPKKHFSTVLELNSSNLNIAGHLILIANKISRDLNIDQKGFRLVINCNEDGGQAVDHVHLHLLGGRTLTWPPG